MDQAHRGSRCVYPNFLPLDLCQELLFIQRSLAVVGYRPNVQSLTLYELLLACPQLLPTVAKARQLIWDAVEGQFDAQCQVWPETTSLISWTAGASIGWHHDANRPYLAARHFSAVAYLNTQGVDFEGGTFCFQSGNEPLQVHPSAGMLLVYTADDSSVHSVEAVTSGERCTLTMWFTLLPKHQEDTKVLSKLQPSYPQGLPSTMYMLGDGQDVRCARLRQRLGVTISPSPQDANTSHTSHDVTVRSKPQGITFGLRGCSVATITIPQDVSASPTLHHQLPLGTTWTTPRPITDSTPAEQPSDVVDVDDVCQPAVVHCALHPAVYGKQHVFASVHDAVMAVCMVEWLAANMPAAAACSTQVQQQAGHGCKACKLLQMLPDATARLQQYLAKASSVFDLMLPVWRQLDALVPPE